MLLLVWKQKAHDLPPVCHQECSAFTLLTGKHLLLKETVIGPSKPHGFFNSRPGRLVPTVLIRRVCTQACVEGPHLLAHGHTAHRPRVSLESHAFWQQKWNQVT